MSGFFSKIFGGGGKKEAGSHSSAEGTVGIVETTLQGLLEKALLELEFTVSTDTSGETEEIMVELSGADEELLTEKEGALYESLLREGRKTRVY